MRLYETLRSVFPGIIRFNQSHETNSPRTDLLVATHFGVDTKRNQRSISVNKVINNIEKYCKYTTLWIYKMIPGLDSLRWCQYWNRTNFLNNGSQSTGKTFLKLNLSWFVATVKVTV